MKFFTFSSTGSTLPHVGCDFGNGHLIDLPMAAHALASRGLLPESASRLQNITSLKELLSLGRSGLREAENITEIVRAKQIKTGFPVHEVRMCAPIPDPSKIIAIGLNYKDHAEEQGVPLPGTPMIFAKFPSCVIGHGDQIRLPAISQKVDPEAELVIVIGRSGRAFTESEAREAIAGYTVGNDVSARDLQVADKQWVRAKSLDTFGPSGPFLVTADELGDPHNLDIRLSVNGEVRQKSNTRNLIFNSYQLVSFISQAITLQAGDLIYSGTPAGVGAFRNPPVFLKAGDVIEVEIQGIGVLRNPVAAS
jgi:2-keto-4-pentenoate hydratase/2-oxohepta-3-ene-1,7-dioic acid hydratase in catechol pathway